MKTGIHFYRVILPAFCLLAVSGIMSGCSRSGGEPPPAPRPDIQEAVYDETGCLYTSYKNLVMAGYQGWFAAEGDASERGWYHYQNGKCGGFFPGCSAIDFWPDMTEYTKKYKSPFKYADCPGHNDIRFFDEVVKLGRSFRIVS